MVARRPEGPASAFEVRIRNVGPIHKADLQLRPLTLLVGANNSGKSVAATVLHVVTASSPPSLERARHVTARRHYAYAYVDYEDWPSPESLATLIDEIAVAADTPGHRFSVGVRRTFDAASAAVFNHYQRQFVEQLEVAFGSELDDIVRVQDGRRQPARVEISSAVPTWCIGISFARPRPRIEIIQPPSLAEFVAHLRGTEYLRYIRRSLDRQQHAIRVIPELLDLWGGILFRSFPQASYYLPAARSGILQSHRTLAAALVRSSTRAGIEDVSVPKVSGLVADFISEVLEITPRRSHRSQFADLAENLEVGLLHGDVSVSIDSRYPEISYKVRGLKLPLHRTSSMVSELAPVVLYLKYILEGGDLLVIEEPESHLHPENQLLMARVIARLATRGLMVSLTTHSDYLLQSLSNAVRATGTGQQELFEDLAGPSGLPSDFVAAYLFQARSGEGGTDTSPVEISPEGGISDDEFARVTEELYRETVVVDRAVDVVVNSS